MSTRSEIEAAAAAALRGEVIAVPTDTVPGVGTRPDDPAATARVFAVKARPRGLALPVLVATTEEAERIAAFDDRARRLAAGCWPGGLTLVLPRTAASRTWDLGAEVGTIGVRVPAHPGLLALLELTGPLAITSANRSGRPPVLTREDLQRLLGDVGAASPRTILWPGGNAAVTDTAAASSVVDLAHGPARLLRAGATPASELAALLGPGEPLLDSGLP